MICWIDMHTLQTRISIRSQAVLVMASVLLWYWSVIDVFYNGNASIWGALMISLPLLTAILMLNLIGSYRRLGKINRGWFWVALIAACSCWILVGSLLVLVLELVRRL